MNSTRSELAQQLRKLGVQMITADYDGSGDSGQIGEPEFGSIWVRQATVTAVQEFFYEVLQEHYAGWEINDGSFGQFVWDVRADSINLVHNTRFDEYDTVERTL